MRAAMIRDQRNYDILITLTGFHILTDYPQANPGQKQPLFVGIPPRITLPGQA